MADQLFYTPMRALDANGDPVPNARAFFFQSQTTTPITAYANTELTAPHPTPIVSDANGVFPPVYFSSGALVRVVAQDAGGAELPGFPLDPAQNFPTALTTAATIGYTPTENNNGVNLQIAVTNASNAAADVQAEVDGLGTMSLEDKADLILSQSDWTAGTSTTESLVSPAKIKEAVELSPPSHGFAPGAIYQNLTGSRASATVYQNTSGYWIQIQIKSSGTQTVSVSADDETYVDLQLVNPADIMPVMVGPGQYYKISSSFLSWYELRA